MILKPMYFYQSVVFYSYMIKNICFWVWFYDLLQRRLIVGRDWAYVLFRVCFIVEERDNGL